MPKLVLMGGRVSGYDTIAGMWRPGGAYPFPGRFRRGAPAVGASETKPYGLRGLNFWIRFFPLSNMYVLVTEMVRGIW
jgi:hypothetical protein